jgi:two-component system cell cycle sensor histidine kinase/response regulator CckA
MAHVMRREASRSDTNAGFPGYAPRVTSESESSAAVLVVDDEVPLLRLMSRVLEKAGHRVLTAVSGDHALEIIRHNIDEIDAVVLDVIIPPRGVSEVLHAVYAARPDIAIVLASGDLLNLEVEEEMNARGGLFLRKPFVPKLLVRTLDEAYAIKGRSREVGGRG